MFGIIRKRKLHIPREGRGGKVIGNSKIIKLLCALLWTYCHFFFARCIFTFICSKCCMKNLHFFAVSTAAVLQVKLLEKLLLIRQICVFCFEIYNCHANISIKMFSQIFNYRFLFLWRNWISHCNLISAQKDSQISDSCCNVNGIQHLESQMDNSLFAACVCAILSV